MMYMCAAVSRPVFASRFDVSCRRVHAVQAYRANRVYHLICGGPVCATRQHG